jgi:predicted Zn-dependent protease
MKRFAAVGAAALLCAACETSGLGTQEVTPPGEAAAKETAKTVEQPSVYTMTNLHPSIRPEVTAYEANYWMIADNAEKRIATAGNLVRDEALNAYVSSVVCKLAGPFCGDIRVYIMRVPDFNASMMPNGAMQVWTGLLLRMKNEAQLATVLGHEIGHYLRQHTAEKYKDALEKTNALVFFQLALAVGGIPVVGDVAALGVLGSIQSFSRDAEREADELGIKFLAENGYDPREAAKVWDRLIRERDADKDKEARSIFFASHPASEERRQTLRALGEAAAKKSENWEVGDYRYNAALKPLRSVFLNDELKRRNYDRFEELLNILREDGANLAETEFFQGELYRVRNEDGDAEKAKTAYLAALKVGDPPPELYRSLGQVYRRLDQSAKADDAFRKYLEIKPEADDRLFIRQMLEH